MIRPEEMRKISITGPKTHLSEVVDSLHELGVLHLDDYSEEDGELDIGDPQDRTEEISDLLVRIRAIRSQMPEVNGRAREDGENLEQQLEDLQFSIDEIHQDLEEVRDEKAEKEELLEKLQMLQRLGLDPEDVSEYNRIDTYIGTVSNFSFKEELPDGRYELYQDGHLIALFVDSDVDLSDALRDAGFESEDLSGVHEIDGNISNEIGRLQDQTWNLQEREDDLEDELEEIAREWRGYLDRKEQELTEELDKAEIPLQFATTDSTFNAEGWIPADRFDDVADTLEQVTDNKIHIEELDVDPDRAPVKHDNPDGIDNFESLIKFYGVPSYKEIDPTFLLITFPLLFGFMIGDLGYGITSFAVFYVMYRKVPEAAGLWKSLMYCSIVTMVFGLIYAEAFGFHIFGPHNDLTAATGITLFEQIPVLFDRVHDLGAVLNLSLLIGIAHVNFGILIGAYNEYISHGLMEAIFAQISWIVLQIGAAIAYLYSVNAGLAVMGLATVMLFKGEGIEGVVEIPSLVSNILSYLRILGVTIAIIALAAVVNQMAAPLFQSGNIFMILFGVLLLVVGHTINTFLKIMEAGLQGIRLHYVEFFTKFFHGGGEYYTPFGTYHLKKS